MNHRTVCQNPRLMRTGGRAPADGGVNVPPHVFSGAGGTAGLIGWSVTAITPFMTISASDL